MEKIKNFEELAVTPLRKSVLEILEEGLLAIDTENVLNEVVELGEEELNLAGEKIKLNNTGKIIVVALGKCASEAAHALEDKLGDKISGGVVLYIGAESKFNKLEGFKGTHPMPSEDNERGAQAIIKVLNGLKEEDLVIFVISGGGSTLLCAPEKMTCVVEAQILSSLFEAGATIQEINTVRKHLSYVRGGFLAKYAYPAKVVSLVFSDVVGNDLQFIASGPTVKDLTTIEEAKNILEKYDLFQKTGLSEENLLETPKEDKFFEKVTNKLVLSNETALKAMSKKAGELGFKAFIKSTSLSGEARDNGSKILSEIKEAESGSIFLYGGESTVTVTGSGKGGRNLELSLSALKDVEDDEILISIASDGRDNSEFAGGICDIITRQAAQSGGINPLDYLENNDAYGFFSKVKNFILTEDTGSNVSDLVIAAKQ